MYTTAPCVCVAAPCRVQDRDVVMVVNAINHFVKQLRFHLFVCIVKEWPGVGCCDIKV